MPDIAPIVDRVPPQAAEAEMAVLGSMLLSQEAVGRAIEIIGEEESFYSSGHRKIYRACINLYERNQAVDLVTVAEELRRLKWLEDAGGSVYLTRLAESVATSANIDYYARIVLEKAVLRRLIAAATQIVSSSYDAAENPEELLDRAEQMIFSIKERRLRRQLLPLKAFIHDSFELVEKLYREKRHITGVETGFTDLDRMTSGLQPSDLVIIGARPSVGKTAFALNVAQHAAIANQVPVAIFSLEMSKEQLVLRMLCSEARVSSHKVRSGYISQSEWPALVSAAGILHSAPMFVDDSAALTPLEIRAKARRLKAEVDLGLVIVDYLQLMRASGRSENRQQEISEISRSLKALAKELNVPVIALSQLSRISVQRGQDSRPILSDLRESGAIEQDADVVLFLHRDLGAHKGQDGSAQSQSLLDTETAELIVAKQRNGPVGKFNLVFFKDYTRFENLETRAEPEP